MSLLALLTGRLAPGVWRSEAPVTEVQDLSVALGWTVNTTTTSENKTDFLDLVGRSVGVPAYVRPNWDSLADGLRDISLDAGDRRLLIVDAAQATSHDQTMIEILDEAAAFWHRWGATFQIVWIGEATAPRLDQVDPVKVSRRSA
jgi:hypothetical protein